MPPKPKYSKDEVVKAAYEIMKEKGISSVVAREVGKKLGTTPGPIFTYFSGMDDLKSEVYKYALSECTKYLGESLNYQPAFKEFGIRWIRYAKENPHAFRMLFLDKSREVTKEMRFISEDFSEIVTALIMDIEQTFGICKEDAEEVFQDSYTYAQGLAFLRLNGMLELSDEDITRRLSNSAISLVAKCRIMKEDLDQEMIRQMIARGGEAARRIR